MGVRGLSGLEVDFIISKVWLMEFVDIDGVGGTVEFARIDWPIDLNQACQASSDTWKRSRCG